MHNDESFEHAHTQGILAGRHAFTRTQARTCTHTHARTHVRTHRVPLEESERPNEPPRELAIGTEGGFQPDKPKYKFETSSEIVLMPNRQVSCVSYHLLVTVLSFLLPSRICVCRFCENVLMPNRLASGDSSPSLLVMSLLLSPSSYSPHFLPGLAYP